MNSQTQTDRPINAVHVLRVGDRHPLMSAVGGRSGDHVTVRDVLRVNHPVLEFVRGSTPRLRDVLSVYEHALKSLGKKPDPTNVRPWLVSLRDAAKRRIALLASLGDDLDGPGIAPLIERAEASISDVAAAKRAVHDAGPDEIRSAKDAVDLAEARERQTWREMNTTIGELRTPIETPDLAAFSEAEQAVDDVHRLIKARQPARALQAALTLAARADRTGDAPLVARLVPCFANGDEIWVWFARRLAEGTDAAE